MNRQIAWITGGSRGIGLACAAKLAANGYLIVISARKENELQTSLTKILAEGGDARFVVCDVSNEASVISAHKQIQAEVGDPTLLINCAGVSPWSTFTEMTIEEFDEAIAVNVRGMFLCSRAVIPAMYEQNRGTIVQMLSVASTKAYRNGAGYVASKFAALGFTNALREEARTHGVRVIGVIPGAVETELWGLEEREKFREKMMQPADIAEVVWNAMSLPERAMVEEITIRPIGGDL